MVSSLVKNNFLIDLQAIYNIILVRNIEISQKWPQKPSSAPPKHQEYTLKYHICIRVYHRYIFLKQIKPAYPRLIANCSWTRTQIIELNE